MNRFEIPKGRIDVVLDTDAYNEVDDQFALAYMLRSKEKLNPVAIYVAPFSNRKENDIKTGIEKSYNEIMTILDLAEETDLKVNVFKGSETYLLSETQPVISPAALDLCERADKYSNENRLYVVAIGAITNIASALIIKPEIKDKIVVVWLGGHAHGYLNTAEFNMRQDIAAARVVMGCGVPFVQLPCRGVVSDFRISKLELEAWFLGKNPLADFLARIAIEEGDADAKCDVWTRIVWDVTAVAWLLNENERFMVCGMKNTPIPEYDRTYTENPNGNPMCYVYFINRDALMSDLRRKLLS